MKIDPYAPPRPVAPPLPRPPTAEVLASCTVVLTPGKLKRRRFFAGMVRRFLYPALAWILGFVLARPGGIVVQVLAAIVGSGVVSILVMLSPSPSRKDASRQTAVYRFYDDGFDVETEGSLSRFEWASIHHFDDGADGFVLHNESVHVFPTHGLPMDDVAALRALFASKVTSRSVER